MYIWYFFGTKYSIIYKEFDGLFCEWAINESCWLIPGTYNEL